MIEIASTPIGLVCKPFIIAEMSGNHNRSLDRALAIVDAAADAGAHAIKLQTYTADTITLDVRDGEFFISDEASLWKGNSLHDLYKQAYTPWEWHAPIMARAREKGLICFSSPFDETAVDFLETLGAPAYKIASFENNHLPLIRKAASTGKPLIVSTGMATLAELDEAVSAAARGRLQKPRAPEVHQHLSRLAEGQQPPDHPASAAACSAARSGSRTTRWASAWLSRPSLTARPSSKSISRSGRADGGVDSAFSLEPEELRALVVETERAWQALGGVAYGPTAAEMNSLVFRRSLYIAKDMEAGEVLTEITCGSSGRDAVCTPGITGRSWAAASRLR